MNILLNFLTHFDCESDLSHIVSEFLSSPQLYKTFKSGNGSKASDGKLCPIIQYHKKSNIVKLRGDKNILQKGLKS